MKASVILILHGIDREKYHNIADELSVNLWCDEIDAMEGIIYLYDPDMKAEDVAEDAMGVVESFGLVNGSDYSIYVEYK